MAAEAWEAASQMVVRKAQELGIESGHKTRTDCTVVESHIHHPTDSSLWWDCPRVLARLMGVAKEESGCELCIKDNRDLSWESARS